MQVNNRKLCGSFLIIDPIKILQCKTHIAQLTLKMDIGILMRGINLGAWY